jgi:uncharacterized pyridoxal phosphate-containing UPF0001 family protein
VQIITPASGRCHSERSEESLFPELSSMGVTHDFEIAIQEGAIQLRLGTAIFEN